MAPLTFLAGLLLLACTSAWRPGRPDHHHPRHLNRPDSRHLNRPNGFYSRNVCYHNIGCFSSDYPFNSTGEVPQDPAFIGTVFKLFTRQHPFDPQILESGNRGSLLQSSFDGRLPVKVLVHGFLVTSNAAWVINQTREFLRKEPTNVITVEWGRGAGFPYIQAASNTRLVGAELANLITLLAHERGTDLHQYHLIGHSLGAHVCGYAGHRLPGIGRITGLDPAQPNFQNQPPMVRLDPSDADFVDVIHTDGSPYNTLSGFGMIQPVGHIDFYPNGGRQQPGCSEDGWSTFMSSAYNHGVEAAELTVDCNHKRASALFLESISSPCPFTAYPCDSYDDFLAGNCFSCENQPCASMGYQARKPSNPASFYLLTMGTSPFCGFHYKVEIQLGNNMGRVNGVVNVRLHGNRKQTEIIEVHRGVLNPGELLTKVFVSSSDVADVEDVHVTFDEERGILDYLSFWNRGDVHVESLATLSVAHNDRKLFCPSAAMIPSGRGSWLTHALNPEYHTC